MLDLQFEAENNFDTKPNRRLNALLNIIRSIPEKYSEGWYNGRKYGISKAVYNDGKSYKIFAEELGGNDFISLNYYVTSQEGILKPCEMEAAKVTHFLRHVKIE